MTAPQGAFFFLFLFMYVCVLHTCMYVCMYCSEKSVHFFHSEKSEKSEKSDYSMIFNSLSFSFCFFDKFLYILDKENTEIFIFDLLFVKTDLFIR